MTTALAKATFNDPQALKTRNNIVDNLMNFLTMMNKKFHKMTVTLSNHHQAIRVLTNAFAAYMKALGKYREFYDTYNRSFQDFLLAVDTLSNAQMTSYARAGNIAKISYSNNI